MKKLFVLASALTVAASVMAQDVVQETIVEETSTANTAGLTSSGRSNWFISIGAGPQVMFGDHDRQRSFGQRISPNLDIAVGKWITPSIGIRLMYTGLYAKGATQNGVFSNGKPISNKPWHGYWLEESKFNFMALHADVMFDMCNIIGGYNPDRVYGLALYAGGGYAHTWSAPHKNSITGNVGIFNMFHVSKAIDINLDLRLTAFDDGFDGADGDAAFDAMVSVSAGITYRFAPRGWHRPVVTNTVRVYDNDAVNRLRAEVNELVKRNEQLEKEIADGKNVERKVVEYVGGNYIVYFPINQSELSKGDRVQLGMCADAIKESPAGTRFLIMGYADKATGNNTINERLSRDRAQAVYDCLVNEFGIDADRLKVEWKGGVDNMYYNDPKLSRVAIISVID